MSKPVILKDKNANQLFPFSYANIIKLNNGNNVQQEIENINSAGYITGTQISQMGYITTFTESDPTVPVFVKNITENDISYWNNKLDSHQDLSGYVSKIELDAASYLQSETPNVLPLPESFEPWMYFDLETSTDGGMIEYIPADSSEQSDFNDMCDDLLDLLEEHPQHYLYHDPDFSIYYIADPFEFEDTININITTERLYEFFNQIQLTKDITSGDWMAYYVVTIFLNSNYAIEGVEINNTLYTKNNDNFIDLGYVITPQNITTYVPSYVSSISQNDISYWNDKQEQLVSGINLKTVESYSLLGSGNISLYQYLYEQLYPNFVHKPDVIYQYENGFTQIFGQQSGSITNTWDLTNLDLSPYKYIKAFIMGSSHNDSANYLSSPIIVTIPLDQGIISGSTTAYTGVGVSSYPNNHNRLILAFCAVDGTKTKFQLIRTVSLYGTAGTDASDNGRYLYRIEGWYDDPESAEGAGQMSITEIDPTVPTWVKNITQDNISYWNSYANVQADWNESDNTLASYILNKPEISGSSIFTVEIEYDDQEEQFNLITDYDDIVAAYEEGKIIQLIYDNLTYYLYSYFEDSYILFVNVDQGNTNDGEDPFYPWIQSFVVNYNNGDPTIDFYANGLNYDDEPTQDSFNLMTSGAIYEALTYISVEPLIVTVASSLEHPGVYSANVSIGDIISAIESGQNVFCIYTNTAQIIGGSTQNEKYTLLSWASNQNSKNVMFENDDTYIEFYWSQSGSGQIPVITQGINKYSKISALNGVTYTQANSYYQPVGNYLTEHQDLSSYVSSGYYDTTTRKIYLRHGTNVLSEIDANDFIKDGMVDTAYVQGSYLVISFNTDAGKQPVEVPIADIFNPINYYTKTEIDNAGYLTAHQDLSSYVSKTELNAAGYLTSHQDIKTINGNTITGTGDVTISGLPEVNSTYNGKILQVVDGAWTLVTPLNLYSGTGTPNNTQGNNGDLYMQI